MAHKPAMAAAPIDFSVIIPTKDRPRLFERALRSVLAQRGADFEIVVADDGNGGGAELTASLRDSRIAAFRTGRLGQVPARSMAADRARGRWLACLDDDDWWEANDHLANLAAALGAGAGLAYTNGRIVRENPDGSQEPPISFHAEYNPASIRLDNKLLVSGLAYARDLHERFGPLDESLAYYWDWDWYLRLTDGGVAFARACGDGVCISARHDNVTAAANAAAKGEELARLCAKHGLAGVVLKNHESIAREQQARG